MSTRFSYLVNIGFSMIMCLIVSTRAVGTEGPDPCEYIDPLYYPNTYEVTFSIENGQVSRCLGWEDLPEGEVFCTMTGAIPVNTYKPTSWTSQVEPQVLCETGQINFQLVFRDEGGVIRHTVPFTAEVVHFVREDSFSDTSVNNSADAHGWTNGVGDSERTPPAAPGQPFFPVTSSETYSLSLTYVPSEEDKCDAIVVHETSATLQYTIIGSVRRPTVIPPFQPYSAVVSYSASATWNLANALQINDSMSAAATPPSSLKVNLVGLELELPYNIDSGVWFKTVSIDEVRIVALDNEEEASSLPGTPLEVGTGGTLAVSVNPTTSFPSLASVTASGRLKLEIMINQNEASFIPLPCP